MDKAVIDLLKTDSEYYTGVGKNYLSNSDIGILLSNPKLFGVEREDSKAFAEGRFFHQLLIEQEKAKLVQFVDVTTRTTKEYKAFIETNNLDFVMLKKEYDNIVSLASVMKSNIYFFDEIYKVGNKFEEPAVGQIQGMMWKGKADIVTDNCIIDLKTTSDINKFKWSARMYNYDSQAYIYQILFGKPLIFFVIDKETQQLGIFRPTEAFVKNGEFKVARAIEVFNKFFAQGHPEDIENYYIDEIIDN